MNTSQPCVYEVNIYILQQQIQNMEQQKSIDDAAETLERALVEMEDLKKFWKDLTWWERDASLEVVFDLIFDLAAVPEYKRRAEMIRDRAEQYAFQNESDYPSAEALAADENMELYYAGNPKLPQGQAVKLLRTFPETDIADLARHIGADDNNTPLESIIHATGRSLSAMFCIRNYVGECSQAPPFRAK
ncbi:MAG: hypothetical protein R2741_02480 [Methanolobus sp.]